MGTRRTMDFKSTIFIFGAALIFISIPPLIAGTQIIGYNFRPDTFYTGRALKYFTKGKNFRDAIAYCNSHSNCDLVADHYCEGNNYIAVDGSPTPSLAFVGSCSWVKTIHDE